MDIATGREKRSVRVADQLTANPGAGLLAGAVSVEVFPDAPYASCDPIRLWDLDSGKLAAELDGLDAPASDIVNGASLAFALS